MIKSKQLRRVSEEQIQQIINGKTVWINEDIYVKLLTDIASIKEAIHFYYDVATGYSPFSTLKHKRDPVGYLNQCLCLADVAL